VKTKIVTLSTLLIALLTLQLRADEGMWLMNRLEGELYKAMKSKGLKLKANEIYNPQSIALSDAIVAIDGGMCSGSIISESGLMITNHHCAYGDIHSLSTPKKNYLEEGFWATTLGEEIPIKGKSVTFLRGIVDVTQLTNHIIDSLDKVGPRGLFFMNKVSSVVEERFPNTPYEMRLTSEWRGEEYFLYLYETYEDVRLVGAPPSFIGAFGGETDNWGWPQHKGDFAIYRVYANSEGKPAKYSQENIPMSAKRYLTISSKGIENDDFIMIMGYPGRTNRYSSSFEVQEKLEILNPMVSSVRRAKLDIWKEHMEQSEENRLQYADKYFGISNYTDYAKWENICLERFNIVERLQERERELSKWISSDAKRVERFGTLLDDLNRGYSSVADAVRKKGYFQESLVRGAELISLGGRFVGITRFMTRANKERVDLTFPKAKEFYNIAVAQLENVDVETDKKLFAKMLEVYLKEIPQNLYADSFNSLLQRFNNNSEKIANYIYSNSIIFSKEKLDNFFSSPKSVEEFMADPIVEVTNTISILPYNQAITNIEKREKLSLSSLRGQYTNALYQMQIEKGDAIYPNANSTMRLTYGTVGGLSPRDGVEYHYLSSTKGILEKEDSSDYEFKIAESYKSALQKGEWGRWGDKGALYVNFLSDNDITGGNSGSAVMNGNGELIGLAFDGNRESMAGDIYFVDGYCKSVSVDIRYVLWVVEKYAKATRIIEELKIN